MKKLTVGWPIRIYHLVLLSVVLVFAGAGIYYLNQSGAATSATTSEAESGALATNATKTADPAASGGQAIRFNASPTPPSPSILLQTTFDSMPVSNPISLANYRTAMGDSTVGGTSTVSKTSIVAESGRGNFMRQMLPANASGGGSGIVTFPTLSRVVDEASIQYDVRFDGNFDWSYGGKLPGLGGARAGTNPGDAAGCAVANDYAWSGRGMWITPGSYPGSSSSPNEWIGYMYNPPRKSECGDNIQTDRSFVAGRWHTIKQYYKLNTPGSANGIHRMWFDGTQVVNTNNVVFRTASDVHVSHIFWAIFRGGGATDTRWQSDRVGYIDVDNLLITTP